MTLSTSWEDGDSVHGSDLNTISAAINAITADAASFATTATAAGTTTLTISSSVIQVFTGATTQTVKLPTTGVVAGGQYMVVNSSTGVVTVQSSGANTIVALAPGTVGVFTAVVATPTTVANWEYQYGAVTVASGKALVANNSLTLAGTDGTTQTFPSTSGNVISSATGISTVSGTPSSSNYLRGDGTWNTPAGGTSSGGVLTPCQGALNGETVTIAAGSITQITGTTVNGYTPSVGDRILVFCAPAASGASTGYTYTTEPANGIYVVTANTTNLTVSRSGDMSGSVKPGSLGVVVENASWPDPGAMFWVTTPNGSTAFTWGTTSLQFSQSGGWANSFTILQIGFGQPFMYVYNGSGNTALSSATSVGTQTLTLPATSGTIPVQGLTSTATAAGTTTLTIASNPTQVFTGSTTQTVKLPTTSVVAGQQYTIINTSTGAVTVQSSGGNTITNGTLAAGVAAIFTALVATPTTAANWFAK